MIISINTFVHANVIFVTEWPGLAGPVLRITYHIDSGKNEV